MKKIKIKNIDISYGDNIIYNNFSICIDVKKINCIVGRSGCGKTSLLNYICKYFTGQEKLVSYVFQEDRLIQWKTIKQNLEVVCKGNNGSDVKIDNLLKKLNLYDFRNYYPNQLSGGMKQRVNIARALIYKSEVIIMDEPFKSIDDVNKEILIDIIKTYNLIKNVTVIMVTHDKGEILRLADKVIVLGGRPVNIIEEYYNKNKHYHVCQQ